MNKKIAFVIPTLSSGGMERVMSILVNYCSTKEGFICYLVIYGKAVGDFYKINDNVKIIRPYFKFNDNKRVHSTIRTMVFLRRIVKEIQPDVLLSFGEFWNNFVLLSLYGMKLPIFISDRSSPNKSLGFVQEKLKDLLYRKSAGFIAQTTVSAEKARKRFPNLPIKVIGNPIRSISIDSKIKRENIIVSVGRLITTKHHDRMINIFAKINPTDWKLIIIGGDSIKQNNSVTLQKQIDNLNMNKKIILAGKQNNVDDYLLKAKIFAFTSSSEGFPNVIGEAMSAGLPVVSYDCVAGPSDMIKDGENGFLTPLFDDILFEEKLHFLMNNKEKRESMGINAQKSISRFSVDNIANSYFSFLIGESI